MKTIISKKGQVFKANITDKVSMQHICSCYQIL